MSTIPKYPTAKTPAGQRRAVYEGRAQMTRPGGLTKSGLVKRKDGRIVSKAKSRAGKKQFAESPLGNWIKAAKQAGYLKRGKGNFKKLPQKGSAGYDRIREIYDEMEK